MKVAGKLVLVLFAFSSPSWGQAAPSGTQQVLDSTIRYAASGRFGGNGDTWLTSTPSGDVNYSNGSNRTPFEMRNSGGYTRTLSGTSGWDGPFVHSYLQGAYVGKHWNASANGNASYRAQLAIAGFSGSPGNGEPIASQPPVGDSILMPGSYVLDYSTAAQAARNLTAATRMSGGFNARQTLYPDGNGLESSSVAGSADFTRRINARSSLSFQYMHDKFSYPSISILKIYADGVTANYERLWTRNLSTTTSAGPEFTRSTFRFLVPPSTSFVANASLMYHLHSGQLSLSFDRSTSSGSGYYAGGFVNSAVGAFSSGVGHAFTFEMIAGYRRTENLAAVKSSVESEFGTVQISKHIGRHASFFVNYTAMNQSSNLPARPSILTEVLHTVSFGTQYSHRILRAKH